jgi:RNA polymerase sigma-70 factor, ECF subfamily
MFAASIDHPATRWSSGGAQTPMSELLSRIARERSDDAFRRLFEELAPRIRGYMMRQGADGATAEELAQETLLAVWSKAGLYSGGKGTAATWIFRIARNLRIDRLRKEVAWQELSEEHAETVVSEEPAPDEELSRRQRELRVRAALDGLPPDQREVVVLAFIEGLSQNEIARRLSLPLGTVKSRVRLAYQKVRETLRDLS